MKTLKKGKRLGKKSLAVLLAILMVATMLVPFASLTASAAAPSTYTNITTNSTASVSISSSGGAKYFKFVPTQSGTYKFYSSNYSGDPYGALLDSTGATLLSNDDGGGNYNFSITYDCTAGTTYYIKAYMYNSKTGSYTLNVQTISTTTPAPSSGVVETTPGTNSYALFNSGATSSSGYSYSTSSNPDDTSYTNNGYDIYASYSALPTVDLGLSFKVLQDVTERATLTVYAYDVDESSGERDLIYLVDETTGTRTQLSGYLSGMDGQWNTTTMYIDANQFTTGHTYHFELTESVSGWVVYVRTVSISLTTAGTSTVTPTTPSIVDHTFTASINSSGLVSTNLYLKTSEAVSYTLEYAATVSGDQRGSSLNQTINATTSGVSKAVSFQLESGSPKGTYQINVVVKDASGNTVTTYTTTAGYDYRAVSYHANGGSNNLPTDTNAYSSGNTVTVLFDYIPSRSGYTFLGWATSATATTPQYTQSGTKTFTIGSADVALYAVWQEASASGAPVTTTHNLFNSGATASNGNKYSSSQGVDANPDSSSYTNNGYDIYGQMNSNSTLTLNMGLSFTVAGNVTERATLTVYAYDVDESGGEKDDVYLVDEITGTRVNVGKLSGMNNQWNTTTIYIDPSEFEDGHTYHFEVKISDTSGSATWWVYIRTVSIALTVGGTATTPPVTPPAPPVMPTVDTWDGTIATGFGGGTGTQADPYLIYTAKQLAYLAQTTNNGTTYSGKYFKLMNNLDLDNREWTPIGKGISTSDTYTSSYCFKGNFNGNGFAIYNLKISSSTTSFTGLFGCLYNATITQLGIESAAVKATGVSSSCRCTAGILAGASSNTTTISKCYVTGTLTVQGNSSYLDIGALVGDYYGSSTTDCYANVTINVTGGSDGHVGGLFGFADGTASAARCLYYGQITGVGNATKSGAIHSGGGSCSLTNCYYYSNKTSSGATSVTSAQLLNQSTYTNFNFTTVWEMGAEHPVLQGFDNAHAHRHSESAWIVDEEATCTTRGSKHIECTSCGVILDTEAIPALGHNYQLVGIVEETCTSDGHMDYACDRDGCTSTKRQILPARGHSFGGDNVCDDCGYTVQVHTHTYTDTVVAPGCTSMGYTLHTCTCGYTYRDNYIDAPGHRWDAGTVTTEKTCTTDGVMTYACTVCAVTRTQILPAGHDWSEVVSVAATCTTDGVMSKTCDDCGTVEYTVIPAGHQWDEGTVITPPTCEEPGVKACTCDVCGAEEEIEIPKLGHHFVNGTCTVCGATIEDIVTPDVSHPQYGMYFEIDDIISNYGPDYINEYGVLLDYNTGATIKKVAVFLTQDGTMWRRCIACVGEGITYATYVPYLSNDGDILYTGLNSEWINIFRLRENADGIWCYSDYVTIGVNLEDAQGNLLLSLYDIGQAGAQTRIFDDLDEMIAWLSEESDCITHVEGEWIVDVEPTCVDEGSKHTECTACGMTMSEGTVPATGIHTEGTPIVDVESTCTVAGRAHTECTVCGVVMNDVVLTAPGHTESGWIVDVEDTCSTNGSKHTECTVCGIVMQEAVIPMHGHAESAWIVDVEPTCVADGSKHTECNECGDTIQEAVIAKLGHTESAWIVDQEPTCVTDGSKHTECSVCHVVLQDAIIPKFGHTESGWIVDDEPTCVNPGRKYVQCDTCGDILDEEQIPALGHSESAWIIDVQPNCINTGSKHTECTVCDEKLQEEVIPATGIHTQSDWIVDLDPTCVADGSKHTECIVCGVVTSTQLIPLLGHVPGDWIIDQEVTCLVDGSKHIECDVCHDVLQTEAIVARGYHVESEWVIDVEPTVTTTGQRHKYCVDCDEVLVEEVMPVLIQISVENVQVGAGATVTVTVDIQNNPGVSGAILTLTYDPSLVLLDARTGSAWNSLNLTYPATIGNSCNFVWDGVNNDTTDGSLLILTFKVPTDADIDTVYDIQVSYAEGNIINEDLENVDVVTVGGSITVIELMGDVNNDGIVDVADIITLRRYLAGGYGVSIDDVQADMNEDGEITVADVVLLRRYISDGSLGE